jgi:hypothetical protein
MGLKRGEKPERIAVIRVLGVSQEPLYKLIREPHYGSTEAAKEGFPGLSGKAFVEMFCDHMRPLHGVATSVTRIEFEYVEGGGQGELWPRKTQS